MSKPNGNTTEVLTVPKAKAADAVTKLKPIVQVDWEDAWALSQDAYNQDEINEKGPLICHDIGFLVRDDKAGITLVRQIFDDHDDPFRHIMHIPRGMVRKVTRLVDASGRHRLAVISKRKQNGAAA